MALGRSQTICHYYMRGICRFGDFCRFSHKLNLGRLGVRPWWDVEEQDVAGTSSYSRQRMWANAPVFVPRQLRKTAESEVNGNGSPVIPGSLDEICPYDGPCMWGSLCPYRHHLELCEMCDLYCLHPWDLEQRKEHNRECLRQHELAMELSFAIARSKDKMCGICFDTIVEKEGRDKRFGILPKCNHVFCLKCIRTWRQAKQFEHTVTRACPECRVSSDFVCPSVFWVDTKEDKEKLLTDYRTAVGKKDCKYFRRGEGKCPFGNKCFYKHALPNGVLVDVGLPWRNQNKPIRNGIVDLLEIYPWANSADSHEWPDTFSSDSSDTSDTSEEY
ncbi:probable E3 ubiquitin-protein ligase makorin-1 [Drosophila rhopaloa]|uniref:RING-type E3 ubiquitin transferase n=1 Tax=Drosophila rhopaloa TaxID=1041015 RepID=A0A6P4EMR5_DRORH|nr:probable E3 ubiquitin-protein ligase makorin-1 [Drosophila rhopaloa]